MISLIKHFGAGNVYYDHKIINFRIFKIDDIIEKIIPYFNKYPIIGVKAFNFSNRGAVVEIMKRGGHLTSEGLEKIRKIKMGMNKGRL
jgi:LAGLIDADG endonuclease